MPPPARRAVDHVREQRQVREAQGVLDAAALDDQVGDQERRDERRARRARWESRRSSPRTFSSCRKRTSVLSQSPEVETTTCGTPAERNVSRELAPLGGGRLGEPLAHARVARVDLQLLPRLRVDEPDRADVRQLLLARVADLDGDDVVAGGEPQQRPAASRAGRGSRRPRRRASGGARAAPRGRRPRRTRWCRSARRSARCGARGAARAGRAGRAGPGRRAASGSPNVAIASRLPRRVATWPTARATPSATSHLRRSAVPKVIDGDVSSRSQVFDRALGDVRAHVRLAGPRGDVPVDPADVVADHVRPHLGELGAVAEHRRPVVAERGARRRAGGPSGRACGGARRAAARGRDEPASARGGRAGRRSRRRLLRGRSPDRAPARPRARGRARVGRDVVGDRLVAEHEPVPEDVLRQLAHVVARRRSGGRGAARAPGPRARG